MHAPAATPTGLPSDWNPAGLSDAALDQQYNARGSVPSHPDFLRAYTELSAQARAGLAGVLDVAYADHPQARLDIFPAAAPGAPVFFYMHGGYWRALSKDDSAFMAPVLQRAGATVVVVDYPLAPVASLGDIVLYCRQALAWVWRHIGHYHGDPGRIHVSGASAGGHLAGMLLAPGWQTGLGVPDDVVHSASPISGLFDLRPLLPTHINGWVGLDPHSASALSPLAALPKYRCPVLTVWGALESDEFKRQSRLYAAAWAGDAEPAAWPGAGHDAAAQASARRPDEGRAATASWHLEVPDRHHFDVVLDWCRPDSALTQAVLALMGLTGPAVR